MRYHVVYSGDSTGSFTEFSAADDAAAWQYAEHRGYGQRVIYLSEVKIRAGGDEHRQLERPGTAEAARERLEYLRGEIQAERISYGELADLQGLAEYIEPGDTELLEWAGVPEFPEPGQP